MVGSLRSCAERRSRTLMESNSASIFSPAERTALNRRRPREGSRFHGTVVEVNGGEC